MTSIIVRTLVIYILLSFCLSIMGKRQLGELEVSELVSTLLVSEIAAIPIDDPDIPLLNAIIPIVLILSVEIIISAIKNKSKKLKNTFEGKADFIIYKGRLLQESLYDNRLSVNELLSEIRAQDVFDISTIKYAIIEKNGTLSIFPKNSSSFAHAIIIDGEIYHNNLIYANRDETWINSTLEAEKTSLEEILLMTVTDEGKINIIKKDGSF